LENLKLNLGSFYFFAEEGNIKVVTLKGKRGKGRPKQKSASIVGEVHSYRSDLALKFNN
jgi:hypothetical protein